ncbi:MAG TPA: aromatic ring-hydroxylating dioxygenase subunit alpha [Xanthobacteraceae bacterium]|nr:aromatic ring-hydroxylating dioxygenase subunit alpha [Xanthobacteraceae bacterium]
MTTAQSQANAGSAYTKKPGTYNAALTEVTRGTPMGELLRRYWHPIGMAADAGSTPRKVRALGEDLILFRDGQGRAGLVESRCCHRGTTLYYGRVEERGIRCCYHGWLFDTEGHCLEQPCEPGGGQHRDRVRQPWYPVEERYGLIFAYMGPPEKKPVLPRYECLDVMDEGETVEADDSSIGGGGGQIIPCNWLQHYENIPDAFHVPVLHGSFSGVQFVAQMGLMPKVKWEYADAGVKTLSVRELDDGKLHFRISEASLPTLRVVPNPRVAQYSRVESIGWVLPIDDTSFRIYVAGRVKNPGDLGKIRSKMNNKLWSDLTEEEHQKFPGDYEAQVGQGPITFHSDEHLATTDQGVVMLRRLLQRQLDAVAQGKDPAGVAFNEKDAVVNFDSGNYVVERDDPRVASLLSAKAAE